MLLYSSGDIIIDIEKIFSAQLKDACLGRTHEYRGVAFYGTLLRFILFSPCGGQVFPTILLRIRYMCSIYPLLYTSVP